VPLVTSKQEKAYQARNSFAYWSFAKLLLWIMPALCLLRISQRSLLSLFNFSNWRKWLAWGGGLGAILGLMGIVSNYWQGEPIFPTELSWPLVNVLVTAPILEEFLMRGAIMGNLERGGSFWIANGMSALMFLILHVPGWLFMGTALNHALPVFLLGLAFGYATKRSGSIMGGIIAHFLNNLF
jgi:membrane protease YdiL (CAAX protease family)